MRLWIVRSLLSLFDKKNFIFTGVWARNSYGRYQIQRSWCRRMKQLCTSWLPTSTVLFTRTPSPRPVAPPTPSEERHASMLYNGLCSKQKLIRWSRIESHVRSTKMFIIRYIIDTALWPCRSMDTNIMLLRFNMFGLGANLCHVGLNLILADATSLYMML